MADILTTIKLQADQYLAEGKKVEELMRGISSEEKKTSAELKQAQAQRTALLKQQEAALVSLKKAQQGAVSIEAAKAYNKQIAETTANIKTLGGKVEEVGKKTEGFSSQFSKLGGVLAAAFSVQQVIAFGQNAVKEFAEAERAAIQLLGALNGNEGAQKRLLNLAKEFEQRFAIDNDVIVAQETFLAIQGRTEEQIRKTIQAAIQFSAVAGGGIEENVKRLDATLEGVTRGLNKFDSRIDGLTDTELKNGAAIDLLNEKYAGFAEKGLESVSGELQRIQVETQNTEKEIGRVVAPIVLAFNRIKLSILESFSGLFDGSIGSRIAKAFSIVTTGGGSLIVDSISKLLFGDKKPDEYPKELDRIAQAREQISKRMSLSVQKESESIESLTSQLTRLKEAHEKTALGTKQFDDERIAIEKLEARIKSLTQTEEERSKALKEAADLAAKEQKEAFDKRQKANEESANKSLAIQLANLDKAKQDELALEETSAAEKLLIDRKYLLERAKLFEDDPVEQAKIAAQIAEVDAKLNAQRISDAVDTAEAVNEQNKKGYDEDAKNQEEAEQRKRDNIQATFEASQELIGLLQQLFSAQDAAQIDAINARKDATIDSIDTQLAALEEANAKGKISDKKFEAEKKKLLASREAAEKKAAAETKKIKTEEAEREKAFAIFSIILNTARAIVAALPNPFLVTLASILGAAQLAIAVATPIPAFAKGTDKEGKRTSGVGLVGENGAEFVFMPSGTKVVTAEKTKKHSRAVDAMIDDRFEDYVYYDFVLPALQEAQRKKEKASSKSFAENIKDSIAFQQTGLSYYDLVAGLGKNNKPAAEALGAAIAKHLNQGYSNSRYH